MDDLRVVVDKVLCDTEAGACVILLKEEGADRILPIWIGEAEAFSIAMAQEHITLPRPITHDLIQSILDVVGVSVDWVRVASIEEGTFYATMRLNGPMGERDVDCRPSDAIAIAMRVDAPIFVSEDVLNRGVDPFSAISNRLEQLSDDLLANLPDEVFGKYKM